MPKTLLLADDSVTIQKVVGISFANEDVDLVTVDNGDEAVSRARELRPDIVLADVVMPGMSGYEVCEAIKSDPGLSHIPVLLLTGTFEAFDEVRAGQAGADGHITKPFEAQALVDTVNARLASAPSPVHAGPADTSTADPSPASDSFDFFESEAGGWQPAEPSGRTTTVMGTDDLGMTPPADDSFSFQTPSEVHAELNLPSPGAPAEPQPTVRQVEPAVGEADPFEAPDAATTLFSDAPALATEPGDGATRVMVADELPSLDTGGDSFDDLLGASGSGPQAALDASDPLLADLPGGGLAGDGLPGEDLPGDDLGYDDLGDPLLASVGPEDLGNESILDPAGGRDYDVSSSDLGDPLAQTLSPTTAPPVEPTPEPAGFGEVTPRAEKSDAGDALQPEPHMSDRPFSVQSQPAVAMEAEPLAADPFEIEPVAAEPESLGIEPVAAEPELLGIEHSAAEPESLGIEHSAAEPESLGIEHSAAEQESLGIEHSAAEQESLGIEHSAAEQESLGIEHSAAEQESLGIEHSAAEQESLGIEHSAAEQESLGIEHSAAEQESLGIEHSAAEQESLGIEHSAAEPESLGDESDEAEPFGVEPVAAEPLGNEPGEAEPFGADTADPFGIEPIAAEPFGVEPGEAFGDDTAEPFGIEPVTAEPLRDEPDEAEPLATEMDDPFAAPDSEPSDETSPESEIANEVDPIEQPSFAPPLAGIPVERTPTTEPPLESVGPLAEDPFAVSAPEVEPESAVEPSRADGLAPAVDTDLLSGDGDPVESATPELGADSRQQLHEALERIAWEAFGDVSERIVKDALERIEKVAWEVIPQMTEALVLEEIRKLKGED